MFTEFRVNPYIEMAEMLRSTREVIIELVYYYQHLQKLTLLFKWPLPQREPWPPAQLEGEQARPRASLKDTNCPCHLQGKVNLFYLLCVMHKGWINLCVCVCVLFWATLKFFKYPFCLTKQILDLCRNKVKVRKKSRVQMSKKWKKIELGIYSWFRNISIQIVM